MHRRTRTILVTAGVLALPLGLMTTAQAQEQADITIRGSFANGPAGGDNDGPAGDVVENRNLGTGSWEFLADGIVMEAPNAEDRAGVYWNRDGGLPSELSLDWAGSRTGTGAGSTDAAAVVVFFDVDGETGNGNDSNALVLEQVYGEDAWLSVASSEDAKEADPSGICDPEGSCANDQGNNTPWFGTFAEWQEALPDARIDRVGVNVSHNGTAAEGLLRSVTFDDDTYTFTSDEEVAPEPEPTTRNVNGASDVERDGRSVDIRFRAQQQPENSVEGNRLRWRVAVVGESSTSFVQGFGDVDSWTRTFRRNTGTYTVRVFKNGEKVRELTVRTNG